MQWESPLRSVQFLLRTHLWGRVPLRRRPVDMTGDFAETPEFRFYQLLIQRGLPHTLRTAVTEIWDIGCRNWSYLPAVAASFPNARIRGVEVDGARRYWNLYRRMDVAEAYAQGYRTSGREVEFFPKNFLKVDLSSAEKETLFCFFYPFVSSRPCVKWGLPTRYADFDSLLRHAAQPILSLGEAPKIFSVHQGCWELELAVAAYQKQGLEHRVIRVDPVEFQGFWPSSHEQFLILSGHYK